MQLFTRRQAITSAITAVSAFSAGVALPSNGRPQSHDSSDWPYVPIDPTETANRAYEAYPYGQCMYASFRAILEYVAEVLKQTKPEAASQLKQFPFHMLKIGVGGLAGQGALCGVVSGCSLAISLFVHDKTTSESMVQELCRYYESTPLPAYKPEHDPFPDCPSVVQGSIICHVSTSAWCNEACESAFSPDRRERCRRLSADMAAKTVELLNRWHRDTSYAFQETDEKAGSCISCHGKGGSVADAHVKMRCATCHEVHEKHPFAKPR